MAFDTTARARLVRVRLDEGKTGLFYATSPDLRGLLVAESTVDAVENAVSKAIKELLAADGESVIVTRLSDPAADLRSWVVLPVTYAEQALAAEMPR